MPKPIEFSTGITDDGTTITIVKLTPEVLDLIEAGRALSPIEEGDFEQP